MLAAKHMRALETEPKSHCAEREGAASNKTKKNRKYIRVRGSICGSQWHTFKRREDPRPGTIRRRAALARPIMSFPLWTMDCRRIRRCWDEWLPLARGRFHAVLARKHEGFRCPATHRFWSLSPKWVFSWIPFFELPRRGGFVRSWAESRAESGSVAILARVRATLPPPLQFHSRRAPRPTPLVAAGRPSAGSSSSWPAAIGYGSTRPRPAPIPDGQTLWPASAAPETRA